MTIATSTAQTTDGPDEATIRDRLQRVFQFLKEQQDHRTPVQRNVSGYQWRLDLESLPEHACVQRRPHDPIALEPLLEVTRPEIEPAPRPPEALAGWVLDGWTVIDGAPKVMEQRTTRSKDGTLTTTAFGDEPTRAESFASWKTTWQEWQQRVRPSWDARKLYDSLFELHAALERDVGRVEAVVAGAHLRWVGATGGAIDHPLLARRVQVEFDATVPVLRVVDVLEAPTEFFARILADEAEIPPAVIRQFSEELRDNPVHPLEPTTAEAWARRAVQSLWVDGKYAPLVADPDGTRPIVLPRSVLLLRSRGQALAEVLVDVRDQIIAGGELPQSLRAIVGEKKATAEAPRAPGGGGWSGTPPLDVLFGKPFNAEQVDLVQQLERHDSVLVQGPPGTGKSHTIANLVGHLTAQGKTVLVTSQKGKALTVLRDDHLISELRPISVSVIREEGSKPLQAAASALLEGMSKSPEQLKAADERFTTRRNELLAEMARLNDEILRCAEGEYREIQTGFESLRPTEAARLVADGIGTVDWLPGPVVQGTTCPLSTSEIERLYALTAEIDPLVEAAVSAGVPKADDLPSLSDLEGMIAIEARCDPSTMDWRDWTLAIPDAPMALEEHRQRCTSGLDELRHLAGDFQALESWEEPLVDVALRTTERPSWLQEAQDCLKDWKRSLQERRRLQIAHKVTIDPAVDWKRLGAAVENELNHLGGAGRISMFRRFASSETRWMLASVTINGQSPATAGDLRVVAEHLALGPARAKLLHAWKEIIGSGPALSEDEGECLALERRFEHRASLARRWQLLATEVPNRTTLHSSVMQSSSVPAVENLPLLREVRRQLATVEAKIALRVQALDARKATMVLEAAVVELEGSASELVREGAGAVARRDMRSYEVLLRVAEQLRSMAPRVAERSLLLRRLETAAKGWADAIKRRAEPHHQGSAPGDVRAAWILRQSEQELLRRHGISMARLQEELRSAQQQLLTVTRELIGARTWRHLLASHRLPRKKQDLLTYTALMRQVGKGTGVLAQQQLKQAREHLEQARAAVPVWIMPLDRVFESFKPEPNLFDVVIVDEASQCDLTGLLAYYLGKKVVVVGDHLQVQPSAIGVDLSTTNALQQTFLYDVPGSTLFKPDTSIYDFAQTSFDGQLMLKEHFRCVPDIIAYSNMLSYDGQIRALRPASAAAEPHLVELVVPRLAYNDAARTNRAEASWIAALIASMARHAAYANRSIGVVSLLYEQQVRTIHTLLLRHVPADAWAAHDIDVGSPSQFQGDERDVMLLSMVSKPLAGPQRLLSERMFKSRFNVAVSRARDQLWLVHSLDPGIDLKDGDYRLGLIKHVRDPAAVRRLFEEKVGQTESPFEQEVLKRLLDAGYDVSPQHQVGYYRIDLVVWDGPRRLAVECDGDRYHTLEDLPKDLERQATLERLGWKFVRIRGSQWYRDRTSTWEWFRAQLEQNDIHPRHGELPPAGPVGIGVEQEIRESARALLLEWGYSNLVPVADEPLVVVESPLPNSDELTEGEYAPE